MISFLGWCFRKDIMEDKEKPKKPGRACDRLRGELLECLVYSDCVQRVSTSTVVIAIWLTVTKYPYLELQQWIFYILYPHSWRGGYILQSPCPSVRLSLRSHFRNRYLSFYWKKWLHIYFLFTVGLTNEWVGLLLARRSVQHLVYVDFFSFLYHCQDFYRTYMSIQQMYMSNTAGIF